MYVAKGICRDEFYYARYAYDMLIMEMFMKMINWKIGIEHGFDITTGYFNKYLKRFLTADEMKRVHGIFPNGEYEDMWDKLFIIYDYFHELEALVGRHFNFSYDSIEAKRVREFLVNKR